MSKENAQAWLKQVTDPAALAGAKDAEDPLAWLVQAGAEAGFAFSSEDLAQCVGPATEELSEEQLESVAGGVPLSSPLGWIQEHIDIQAQVNPDVVPDIQGEGGVDVPATTPLGDQQAGSSGTSV